MTELLCVLYISGVLTCIRNVESAIPGEVSFHFVYALQVYDQTTPARIDLQVGVQISTCCILCPIFELRERIIQLNNFYALKTPLSVQLS